MSKHEHKWNAKTLVCVSCGASYIDTWNEHVRKYGYGLDKTSPGTLEITQLERGVKA